MDTRKLNRQLLAERTALSIAGHIIKFKRLLADQMNRWFGTFSNRQKKFLLVGAGVLLLTFLLTDCLYPVKKLSNLFPNSNVRHIGQASGFPFSKLNKR